MGASDGGKLSPAGDLHHKCHNYENYIIITHRLTNALEWTGGQSHAWTRPNSLMGSVIIYRNC